MKTLKLSLLLVTSIIFLTACSDSIDLESRVQLDETKESQKIQKEKVEPQYHYIVGDGVTNVGVSRYPYVMINQEKGVEVINVEDVQIEEDVSALTGSCLYDTMKEDLNGYRYRITVCPKK